jgi:hypothetical protein
MDEFEDVALHARLPMTPAVDGTAHARKRTAIARVVSRIYRVGNEAQRVSVLTHLLRPLGVLGLVAVASGAFARLVRRDGLMPNTFSAEDKIRYSSEQVRELTAFVHEVDPNVLQPLIEQLTQDGMGIAALSTAALVLLCRGSSTERERR